MRKTGILLAISSLPSTCGIGDFGKEAITFIDTLCVNGVAIWQILPLNPMGHGNSPYQPFSSFAMDEIYLNIDDLRGMVGLPCQEHSFNPLAIRVDYDAVRMDKEPYLRECFQAFKKIKDYENFIQIPWVMPYVQYRVLRKLHPDTLWNQWKAPFNDYYKIGDDDLKSLKKEIEYELFLQYALSVQWMSIKKYANQQGIEIMGDLPIYVGLDSADVWANRDQFLLDKEGKPSFVAGVPPDYFSATGQRWGNPLYDWAKMEADEFVFWKERLRYNSLLFDCIRIDHFRGFDTYWKIPVECESAVDGVWEEAPGYALFDELFNTMPQLQIIAEDLGLMREEVYTLRDHYNLLGMRIIQFSFDPRNLVSDRKNCIVYTGTHDNQTIRSWFMDHHKSEQKEMKQSLKELGFNSLKIEDRFVQYALASNADIAIIPMQDLLGLLDDARMNKPGTVNAENWVWKMDSFEVFNKQVKKLSKWLIQYHR